MDSPRLFGTRWPDDLDPADVPFRKRTFTVLRRQGFLDDPGKFDGLTEADAAAWWNCGPVTVQDLRDTGDEAIRRHHAEFELLQQLNTDLSTVRDAPWAPHIWSADPRFTRFLPAGTGTVSDIATSGSSADRRFLWDHLDELEAAIEYQASLTLLEAVGEYVEAVSGQHGERLTVLLARTGLNGKDPISAVEAAERLGVSYQRIYQIVEQLHRNRIRATPPAGIWLPQIGVAERDEWPEACSSASIDSIRGFLGTDWECQLDLAPPRSSDLAPLVVTVGGHFVVPVRVVRSR